MALTHGNVPIQWDLWGNEVIFKRKGQTTLYGIRIPKAGSITYYGHGIVKGEKLSAVSSGGFGQKFFYDPCRLIV